MDIDSLPEAIEAEPAVLGRLMLSCDQALPLIDGLRPRHFVDLRHQLILQAIKDLVSRGEPVDLITVNGHLRQRGQLDAAGGTAYLSAVETRATSIEMVATHVRHIRLAKAQRLVATLGNDIYKVQTTGNLESEGALTRAKTIADRIGVVASAAMEKRGQAPQCLRADELLARDLPPVKWSVSGEGRLLIPAGSVGALFGWGGAGKSLQAMELAISRAAGLPWLGVFPTHQCPVLYVDFELPQAMLQARLAWLLAAMGVEARGLPLYLWSAHGLLLGPERSVELERKIRATGARDVTIDSITMATMWDEMDPVAVTKVFRNCLYPIRDKGVGLMLVDHSRKPGDGQRGTGASVHDMRGTTAKINCLDWAIGVEHQSSQQGERLVFSCAKARYGPIWPPFSARLEPMFPEGRRSVFDGDYQQGRSAGNKSAAIRGAIRTSLQERPAQPQASLTEVLEAAGHKERTIEQVISDMVDGGELKKAPDPTDKRRNILSLPCKEPGA